MKAMRAAPWALLLAALVAWPLAPSGAMASGEGPATAAADYVVASPLARMIEPAPATTFVNGSLIAYPEVAFDGQGNLVLAYHDNGSAAFARFNKTTADPLTPPTQVSNRTTSGGSFSEVGRGPHAALNGQGEIVTAYWDYIDPGTGLFDRVYIASHTLEGAPVLSETLVGQSQSYFYPSPSVAIGVNDSVYIAREVPDGAYENSAIGLEHRQRDGSPIFTDLTVFNDSGQEHYPQLVADLARSRLVLAWYNDTGEARVVALELNGSRIWGPVAIQTGNPGLSLTVGGDGTVFVVFVDNAGDLRASKFGADGVLLADRQLVASASGLFARVPRCALSPQGELYVVWQEEDGSGLGDIRAAVLNASTMGTIASPSWVSREDQAAEMPHIAFTPAGVPWVVWRVANSAVGAPDLVNGTSLSTRAFSFEVRAPGQEVTVYRAEPNDIPLNITSFSDVDLNYAVDFTLSSVRGPWNWTVEFLDAATGSPALSFDIPGNGSARALARVTPPVWDPPGNGLVLFLVVRESRFTDLTLSLQLNLTALAGHAYSFAPSSQNATGLAGSTAQLAYQLRNDGVFEAPALPVTLVPAPPQGWAAAIAPAAFSALPGEAQVVTLTITSPPGGTSADAYCGVVQVQHPVDVFALATASFCAGVALVAEPRVTPQAQALAVDSGTSTPLHFTFENAGNSASPLVCRLAVVEALPSGWSITGEPSTLVLPRNAPAGVDWDVVVSPSVVGGTRLELTVQGTCEGVSTVQNASVVLTVREVHDPQWGAPPSGALTNASGGASLTLSLENLGNVPEALWLGAFAVPSGWTGTVSWRVDGLQASVVGPGKTAEATVSVRAPPRTEAGTYRFNLTLGEGAAAGSRLTFAVEVPAASGIAAQFGPPNPFAGPGQVVSFIGRVVHLGNSRELYQLKVTVASPQFWGWTAEFIPSEGAGSPSFSGGYLDLPPFAEGTLYVYLTAPAAPSGGDAAVNISLASAGRASASFVGLLRLQLPDLHVAIEAVPAGEADPLLVGGILVNVTCTGGVRVDNVTLRVTVDGVGLFDSRVGPFCGPDSTAFEITVSLAPGAHSVTAAVDPDQPGANPIYGFVLEADEDNNVATRAFSVQAAAAKPPPATNATSAGLGGSAALVVVAGLGGAGAVAGLAVLRRRREKPDEP